MMVEVRSDESPLLLATHLSKSYARVRAVDDVSLQVFAGEIVGLVGPNGAGKTTLLMTLIGALRADSGHVEIAGETVRCGRHPRSAYIVPDVPSFYDFLLIERHLRMSARLRRKPLTVSGTRELLDAVGLSAALEKRVADLSRGMKQRLAWAHALLASPQVLLLDEPTSALDPVGVVLLRDVVLRMARAGTAVLFSSHTLPEVERLCQRVLFLDQGKLSCLDTSSPGGSMEYEFEVAAGPEFDPVVVISSAREAVHNGAKTSFKATCTLPLAQIISRIEEAGAKVERVSRPTGSLEQSVLEKIRQGNPK